MYLAVWLNVIRQIIAVHHLFAVDEDDHVLSECSLFIDYITLRLRIPRKYL